MQGNSGSIAPSQRGVTICPTCGRSVRYGEARYVGSYDGENRWRHWNCPDPIRPNDADVAQREREDALRAEGARAATDRILSAGDLDPTALPVTWQEWDALDGEEKGATLEDYFRIVAEATGQKATTTGGERHVV